MPNRDEFPKKVVLTLGQRAGYLCSNPSCRRPTAGPHSQPDKALITGEAGHICSASEGGPRYDPNQTPKERKSITNAIWLCSVCHKKLDIDWKAWPVERLRQMKAEHEQWIADEGMIPTLPDISLTTRTGLRPHANLPSITGEMLAELRELDLTIKNDNTVPLFNLKLGLHLPEPIVAFGHLQKNTGTRFSCKPLHVPWTVESVQTGGAVRAGDEKPSANHLLEIAALSAKEYVQFSFYTAGEGILLISDSPGSPPRRAENPDEILQMLPQNLVHFFLEGTYQFVLRGEYITADVFVPLRYNFKDRITTSLPCRSSRESWNVPQSFSFPGIEFQG
jgi:hypothetical protein